MLELLAYTIIGVAVAFNILIIKVKFERGRFADVTLDFGTLVLLSWLFSGSYGGLVVSTLASAIISLYLLRYPPTIPKALRFEDD